MTENKFDKKRMKLLAREYFHPVNTDKLTDALDSISRRDSMEMRVTSGSQSHFMNYHRDRESLYYTQPSLWGYAGTGHRRIYFDFMPVNQLQMHRSERNTSFAEVKIYGDRRDSKRDRDIKTADAESFLGELLDYLKGSKTSPV